MKMYNKTSNIIPALAFLVLIAAGSAAAQAQCGRQAGNALCRDNLCCSQHGFCGDTTPYCGAGCQSQCPGPNPNPNPNPGPGPTTGGGVAGIVTRQLFEEMLKHRNNGACPARGFYTYEAFLSAAAMFPGFGTSGDDAARRRELAAFFGQTSHETTGGWPTAPDGPFAWGYCHVREVNRQDYCDRGRGACAPGQQYYGRGPIQLTHNYNYILAGSRLNLDLLNNPDQVATNAVTSFRTAIWFWMTAQGNKPSSHDVIIGRWTPSATDNAARRVPGFGVITNIINGGLECAGRGVDRVNSRIGFYRRYCDLLRVATGPNLDCNNQAPFG